MTSGPAAVEISGLARRFGRRWALAGVDLTIERGAIVGLVGPNGSGKTTLLKTLAGLIRPTRGQVRVWGLDPVRHRDLVMRQARFAFAPPPLFDSLTARQHLERLGAIHAPGMPRVTTVDVRRTLTDVGLHDRADEPVRNFSFGMRQRLTLAQALLPLPDLLVLDEPTDGLDPLAIIELRDLIRRLREEHGVAVLLSSHLLVEVELLVDELLVLFEGETVFHGPPSQLREGPARIEITASDTARALSELRCHDPDARLAGDGRIEMARDDLTLARAAELLRNVDVELLSFHRAAPTLEAALLARLRDHATEPNS